MNLTKSGKALACAGILALMQILMYLCVTFANAFLLVLTLLPLITILLSVLLSLLTRNKWMVVLTFALSYILGMFLFFNTSFWVWVVVYTVLALVTTVLMDIVARRH